MLPVCIFQMYTSHLGAQKMKIRILIFLNNYFFRLRVRYNFITCHYLLVYISECTKKHNFGVIKCIDFTYISLL